MCIGIWMLLLEGDITMKFGEILSKRTKVFFKIFSQLLASDLMRAAINNKSSQVFPALLLVQICLHFVVHGTSSFS